MEEAREKKQQVRDEIKDRITSLSAPDMQEKTSRIESRLFEFANFMESETVLFYLKPDYIVNTRRIVERCLRIPKKIVLPAFGKDRRITLWKITSLESDMLSDGITPDPERCKPVSFKEVDIAVIPGVAFDEKGGRLGTGRGHNDRMMPKLPNTTRKVALALTEQIVPQVPMEPHDKYIDIIITDKRTIYKI